MRLRLTDAAERDADNILGQTLSVFGERQLAVYAELIATGLRSIAADPTRASARRLDLDPGVSSLHLATVARRRGAARHVIYYRVKRADDGNEEIQVLRILHDRMDPARHLA